MSMSTTNERLDAGAVVPCPFHRFGCNATAASETLINEHKMESVRALLRHATTFSRVLDCSRGWPPVSLLRDTLSAGAPASAAGASGVCVRVVKGTFSLCSPATVLWLPSAESQGAVASGAGAPASRPAAAALALRFSPTLRNN